MTITHIRPIATAAPEPVVSPLRDGVYEVSLDGQVLGFIERVGNVFVALMGRTVNCACEVGQSLSWETSVRMVLQASRTPRSVSQSIA